MQSLVQPTWTTWTSQQRALPTRGDKKSWCDPRGSCGPLKRHYNPMSMSVVAFFWEVHSRNFCGMPSPALAPDPHREADVQELCQTANKQLSMSEKLEAGKLSLAFYVNAHTHTLSLYIQHSQVKHTHPPSCSPPPLHHGRRGGGEREIPNHLNLFQLSGQRGVRAIIPPWCIPLPKRIPSLGSAWSAYCVMGTEGTSHPPNTHIKKKITEGSIRNSKAGA